MALNRSTRLQQQSAGSFGTGTFTTNSFTPSNNSVLVVILLIDTNNQSIDTSLTLSGGGLTWTRRVFAEQGFVSCSIWTAEVVSAASMTLSVDCGSLNIDRYTVCAYDETGYVAGDPVGASGTRSGTTGGAPWTYSLSAALDAGSETFSGAITTVGAGSVTVGTGWTGLFTTDTGMKTQVLHGTVTSTVTYDNVDGGIDDASAALEILEFVPPPPAGPLMGQIVM